jgi:MATE family multidrug resistance protein
MMVGRLPNPAMAIGVVSLGNVMFHTLGFFGGGILLGLDPIISQAFGRKDVPDCNRSLIQGLWLAIAISIPLTAAMLWGGRHLTVFGIGKELANATVPFLDPLAWSTPALMIYFAARRYLQAIHQVKAVMYAYVVANIINAVANWVLIYGHLGFPAMGVAGSGWSTFIGRMFLAVALLAAIGYFSRRDSLHVMDAKLGLDWVRISEILRMGVPVAFQITLEVGVFGVASILVARLGEYPLAAHQIAITVVSTTFMVPLGTAAATSVAVGHAIGARDAQRASDRGWTGIAMGGGFMALSGLVMFLAPQMIVRIFTADKTVASIGVSLLAVGAVFQFFDGVQGVSSGALRGAGETRVAMITNFFGYWVLGFPIGYSLCFKAGLGAPGVWIGLCVGLIVVSVILATLWHRKTKALRGLYSTATV